MKETRGLALKRLSKKGSSKGLRPFGINSSPSPFQGERDTGGEVFRQPLRPNLFRAAANYVEVLKPRETALLTFIGICTAFIAAGASPPLDRFFLALVAITLGCGGVNALTNYLDRKVDARMERTRRRVLPSQRIEPAEKVLPFASALVIIALALAWWLSPFSFLFGLIGTITAVVFRKTAFCPVLGAISGSAPVLIGWFAFKSQPDMLLLLLVALIVIWIPWHVWSVMLAYRGDYLQAGIGYFPLNWKTRDAVRLLLALSLLLFAVSWGLYFVAHFGWFYLAVANILGIIMIYANLRLVLSATSQNAWKVYKLSAFPYLGLLFLTLAASSWLAI